MEVSAEFVEPQLIMQVLRWPREVVDRAGKANVRFRKKIELSVLVAELHTNADAAIQPSVAAVIPPREVRSGLSGKV